MMNGTDDVVAEFIEAACVPLEGAHTSGTLERAEAIRAAHPEVANANIHTAAVLGDGDAVLRFIAAEPASATAQGGPRGWDALTHLCFSRYLQHDRARSDGFVRAARALLQAGASASTGWLEKNHQPAPEWEPVLYGAAGVAHHAELARLLVEHGADVNDCEVVYHTPESDDNAALGVLVETGRITPENLALMLIRKADWHDLEGARYLLEHGADPNQRWGHGFRPIHHAIRRDNRLEMVEVMLDHGADPTLGEGAGTAVALAARRGRGDVLALFRRRGITLGLAGADALAAACAGDDADEARRIAADQPEAVRGVVAEGGRLLAEFAGNGNAAGVAHLLELGVDVAARYDGDGYFGIARGSTALHVAAWRAHPSVVNLLIDRGAPVDLPDGAGQTPLALAVRACVDSFWSSRRTPASVEALLRAGASAERVAYPSGYAEVDALLARYRGGGPGGG